MQNNFYSKPLARFAWFLVGYTILVILWGAFVRATGSGAGCGSHWPTCNGEIIPRAESVETLIEFSHRLTSAFMGVLVIGLVAWAWRVHGLSHRATKASIWTLVFTIIEGGIGAAIVIFEYVADNESTARALWMGVHLINTLILLGILVTAAWWCSGGKSITFKNSRPLVTALAIGFAGLLIVSAFGAITALGDTLFPAESFAEGASAKFEQDAHFSVRARIWHPTLAVAASIYLVVVLWTQPEFTMTASRQRWQRISIGLIFFQLAFGSLNALLAAPIWMQLGHLLLTDLIWGSLVILMLITLEKEPVILSTAAQSTQASFGTNGQRQLQGMTTTIEDR
ncbi:MAG: COX15/CtaA family protein [Chloroflexota bacterium]